jgi:hypothetical protein
MDEPGQLLMESKLPWGALCIREPAISGNRAQHHASLRLGPPEGGSGIRVLPTEMMRSIAMNRLDSSQPVSHERVDVGMPIFVSPTATLATCLMVFGVLHAVATLSVERDAIDGLLVINVALYVAAALLARSALRRGASMRSFRLTRYAHHFSVAGLSMTIIGICCLALVIAIRA